MDYSSLIKGIVASLVRHVLTGVTGYLVAKGLITGEQGEQLIIAAVLGAVAIIWALWNKYQLGEKIRLALALPSGATPEQLERAVEVKSDPVALREVASEVRIERAGEQI